MSILLANDDGVEADGLRELAAALAGLDDLYISAPSENRSGVGMSITITDPLNSKRHSDWSGVKERWSIDGTPADAVKFGLQHLLKKDPPRLVVSGINLGANVGRNVRCSGTVGAAFEGLVSGFPALAVSVDYDLPINWDGAKHYARLAAEKLLELSKKQSNLMFNLNVPSRAVDKIKGLKLTRHGSGGYLDNMIPHTQPGSYTLGPDWQDPETGSDCDARALTDGFATITPMRYEMTDQRLLDLLQGEWKQA